jgi:hypothetical protein
MGFSDLNLRRALACGLILANSTVVVKVASEVLQKDYGETQH